MEHWYIIIIIWHGIACKTGLEGQGSHYEKPWALIIRLESVKEHNNTFFRDLNNTGRKFPLPGLSPQRNKKMVDIKNYCTFTTGLLNSFFRVFCHLTQNVIIRQILEVHGSRVLKQNAGVNASGSDFAYSSTLQGYVTQSYSCCLDNGQLNLTTHASMTTTNG